MRTSRAFAVTAIVTLALGIGGNTAMFTVIRAVLLKPLEYGDADRLIYFSQDNLRPDRHDDPFSLKRLEEMRSVARSFTALGAYGSNRENLPLSGEGEPEGLKATRVSANFLEVLGVRPLLGRSFLPEEDQRGGRAVAMISASLWQRRFGGDPHIVGRAATLDSIPYTIIGVLPAGFEFPYAGTDVWVTRPSEFSMLPPRFWGVPLLAGFGRLKPGVTLEQARAEMEVLSRQYNRAHPSLDAGIVRPMRLKDHSVEKVRTMLWMLFGAVGFVLLIACANVASLLLARATGRSREFALRAALGAGRGRLVRQLLAESLVLATAGGVLGALLANWALGAMRGSLSNLPGGGAIHLDAAVLGFTIALSIVTGVLFGLFPSLQISQPDLADALRESGAGAGQGMAGRRGAFGISPRAILVTGQIAFSVVLLIGAALLIESFARLRRVDPGFNTANLLTTKIALPAARYSTDAKKAAFFTELADRLNRAPGVSSAAMAMFLPTTRWIRTNILKVEGQPPFDESDPPFGVIQSVTPGYFHTLGIPLRQGREFTARDNVAGAPPAMVINESMARRLWPEYPRGIDPVGRHIAEAYDKAIGWFQIVGIAADIHEGGVATQAVPEFYVPVALHPPQTGYFAIRTAGDPLSFVNAARSEVQAIDRDQPISEVRTMDAIFDATLGQRRLTMLLLGGFAGVALLLALVGIYGVIAYSVAQRTQEVGIRRALGAQQSDILRLVLGQGLALSLGGVAIGIGGAFALTRVMEGLLFEVKANDPGTFAGIAVVFIAVALAASFIPAYRAARIDPMKALRVG